MKKLLLFTMICSLALFSACGEKVESELTSEVTDVESDITETTNNSSYEEDEVVEDVDADNANTLELEEQTESELPRSKYKAENYPDYIPMDEFWISNNEFDLVGWYEANGAIVFFCDMFGEESYEESSNIATYSSSLVYSQGCWEIHIGSDNYSCIRTSVNERRKYITVYEYSSKEKNDVVTIKSDVNDFRTYRDHLEKMDEAMRKIKADPTNGNLEF